MENWMKLEGKTQSHPLRGTPERDNEGKKRKDFDEILGLSLPLLLGMQFVSLAADQSGEVICAGTLDSFEIFVWSMKTGRLLDILSGHEGPVHSLVFSPTNAILASSSWDKTVRLWDVFEGKGSVEPFPHTHDVLTVVYRPDGKQ
ncbi:hypothetical protein Q3G72_000756 [Acer saccharum]|nr:hypothetical protein Q3G72_000756 [Acer saccharum]